MDTIPFAAFLFPKINTIEKEDRVVVEFGSPVVFLGYLKLQNILKRRVKKLKSQNYRLIALTNWGAETFPVALERFEFLKLFKGIVVSGEIKMLKPGKEIYEYTLSKYNLYPDNCIFIDDRLSNVEGAIKCGINGIQFISPKKLITELKNIGVEI